jgi:hypothetical protein
MKNPKVLVAIALGFVGLGIGAFVSNRAVGQAGPIALPFFARQLWPPTSSDLVNVEVNDPNGSPADQDVKLFVVPSDKWLVITKVLKSYASQWDPSTGNSSNITIDLVEDASGTVSTKVKETYFVDARGATRSMMEFGTETGLAFAPNSTAKLKLHGTPSWVLTSDLECKIVGYLMKK